jgi:protein gp37
MSTTIEWTDETWNPVTGCDRISPGCAHCYAKSLHDMRHRAHLNGKRMPLQYHEPFEHVHCWPERLEIPLHWRAPRLCFVNSGADIFHEDVDFPFLGMIYAHMAIAHWHTFQFLTKRPERMLEWYSEAPKHPNFFRVAAGRSACLPWPLPNVWPGVSVESKKYLYRLDLLRQVPAPVRMVSFEPLLEDLGTVNLDGIGWAIVGGESGVAGRPFNLAWAESLRDQCKAADVPFFMKQVGSFPVRDRPEKITWQLGDRKGGDPSEWPEGLRVREFPKPYPGHQVVRLARRKAA